MGNARSLGALAVAALLSWVATAHAQEVLVEFEGAGDSTFYGLTGGSDYDGDGTPDFITGSDPEPSFVVVSGKDGSVLKTFSDLAGSSAFASVFYPDVTGDGVPEVVIGLRRGASNSSPPGVVLLLNGATGEELWSSPGNSPSELYGQDIRLIPDVNSDGRPDVLAAGYLTGRLLSGADGSRLSEVSSSGSCCPSDRIAPVGDLNGDDVPDYLVGSQRFSGEFFGEPYPENGGIARVVSGANGEIIREHRTKKMNNFLGVEVVSPGDLDRDGVDDYLVGELIVKGKIFGGGVTAYSGRKGKRIARIAFAPTLGIKSATLLGLVPGDLDKDGFPDFAIQGQSDTGQDFFAIVSGNPTNPVILFRLDKQEDDFFGSFGLAGDVDDDGLTDLLVSYVQSGTVQIVKMRILPNIPKVVKNARAFTRAAGNEEAIAARLSLTIKKGVQTLSVATEGLVAAGKPGDGKAATGPFGVFLEDAVGAGTFTKLGSLDASGTYTIVGQGTVPPQLGVQSLADVVGRRLELRDAGDAALLETVIPDLVKAKKAKAKGALAPVSAAFPKAKLKLKASFNPKTGALDLKAKVKNAGAGPFVFELETSAGSGVFEEIARVDGSKLKLSTGTGAPLAGAFSVTDLLGRAVRVFSDTTLVLEGSL